MLIYIIYYLQAFRYVLVNIAIFHSLGKSWDIPQTISGKHKKNILEKLVQ